MAYLTDQELLSRYEYYTIQLEDMLAKGEDIKTLCDHLPCAVVLSRPKAIEIVHTNKRHLELTGYSPTEVREHCPEFLNDIIHPVSLQNIKKFVPEFYAKQNHHQTMSFVQYVQLYGGTDYTPLITFTKAPIKSVDLVIRMPILIKEFGKLSTKMEQIVKMDQFKLIHFKRFQKLTNREVEVMTLLANGYNNPKIADNLFLSRSTVETHRKSIKRKLDLNSLRDLMKYAFAFNLVEI